MEILFFLFIVLGVAFGGGSKKDRKRRYNDDRRARDRRYRESLGYYEHLYGQGHP